MPKRRVTNSPKKNLKRAEISSSQQSNTKKVEQTSMCPSKWQSYLIISILSIALIAFQNYGYFKSYHYKPNIDTRNRPFASKIDLLFTPYTRESIYPFSLWNSIFLYCFILIIFSTFIAFQGHTVISIVFTCLMTLDNQLMLYLLETTSICIYAECLILSYLLSIKGIQKSNWTRTGLHFASLLLMCTASFLRSELIYIIFAIFAISTAFCLKRPSPNCPLILEILSIVITISLPFSVLIFADTPLTRTILTTPYDILDEIKFSGINRPFIALCVIAMLVFIPGCKHSDNYTKAFFYITFLLCIYCICPKPYIYFPQFGNDNDSLRIYFNLGKIFGIISAGISLSKQKYAIIAFFFIGIAIPLVWIERFLFRAPEIDLF